MSKLNKIIALSLCVLCGVANATEPLPMPNNCNQGRIIKTGPRRLRTLQEVTGTAVDRQRADKHTREEDYFIETAQTRRPAGRLMDVPPQIQPVYEIDLGILRIIEEIALDPKYANILVQDVSLNDPGLKQKLEEAIQDKQDISIEWPNMKINIKKPNKILSVPDSLRLNLCVDALKIIQALDQEPQGIDQFNHEIIHNETWGDKIKIPVGELLFTIQSTRRANNFEELLTYADEVSIRGRKIHPVINILPEEGLGMKERSNMIIEAHKLAKKIGPFFRREEAPAPMDIT